MANDPVYSEERIWVSYPIILSLILFLNHLRRKIKGPNMGKGGIDIVPSEERSAPEAPAHLRGPPDTNPDRFDASTEGAEDKPKLLPRETGHDIGMGSPVPLSAEAVGVITRLRNMKVLE